MKLNGKDIYSLLLKGDAGAQYFIITTSTSKAPEGARVGDIVLSAGADIINVAGYDLYVGDVAKITSINPFDIDAINVGNIRGEKGEKGDLNPNSILFTSQELEAEQQAIARDNISAHRQIMRCYRDYESAGVTWSGNAPEVTIRVDFPYTTFTNNTHIEVLPANAATEEWLINNLNSTIATVDTEQAGFTFSAKAEPTSDFAIYFTISEMAEG